MVLTDNIARFQTTLIENKSSLKTTLRENETTLFENRPITSDLDRINANSYNGIPAAFDGPPLTQQSPDRIESLAEDWPCLEQHGSQSSCSSGTCRLQSLSEIPNGFECGARNPIRFGDESLCLHAISGVRTKTYGPTK